MCTVRSKKFLIGIPNDEVVKNTGSLFFGPEKRHERDDARERTGQKAGGQERVIVRRGAPIVPGRIAHHV